MVEDYLLDADYLGCSHRLIGHSYPVREALSFYLVFSLVAQLPAEQDVFDCLVAARAKPARFFPLSCPLGSNLWDSQPISLRAALGYLPVGVELRPELS